MRIDSYKLLFGCIALALFFSACSKTADFKDYLKQVEKVYPGRPDSILVKSGFNRGQITTLISPDPRVVKIRVYWNTRRDSIEAVVSASDYAKRKTIDIPVIPEGIYTFEVATFDGENHRSVFSEKTGQIYGLSYIAGLANRVFKSKTTVNGSPALVWFTETDKESPITGIQVTYPKVGGDSLTIFTPKLEDVTVMVNGLAKGTARVRTAYLPLNSLETFYSTSVKLAY